MQAPRRPARAATEPRLGASPGNDLNRERLVFCLTSLVGHRVTAKLRGNVVYEGLFHSCSLDGDYSITLKLARRLSTESNSRSGEVVQTLVIPGKDYLQVSAIDLPSPWAPQPEEATKAFATDGEIAGRKDKDHGGERELVPWSGGEGGDVGTALEDGGGDTRHWDQFKENKERWGIQTTYREDYYTTTLDKEAIPQEQRERADRIAKEIMSGQMNSEIEGKIDEDDADGEARFSDVRGNASGGNQKKDGKGNDGPQAKARMALAGHDALPTIDGGLARDIRNKRGMISEMKRINALNLEPTLPKPDSSTQNSRINYTESQARNPRIPQGSSDLKSEFQQSLMVITKQQESRQQKNQQASSNSGQDHQGHGGPSPDGSWQGQQAGNFMMQQRKPDGSPQPSGPGGGGYPQNDQGRQKFSLNPHAKAFSLNPQAGEFTPGGSNAGGGGGGGAGGNSGSAPAPAAQKPAQPMVQFAVLKKNPDLLRSDLSTILEPFYHLAGRTPPESGEPGWPDAKGPSYHEVLGQPNPGSRPQMVGAVPGPGGGQRGPVPGPGWQQGPPAPDQTAQPMGTMGPGPVPAQQMGTMGPGPVQVPGAPQMMQQGFVVTNAPPGGAPPQMYQQMYAAPSGPGGPQGPQGTATGMPPQGGQQPVVFGNQTMMAQQPNQSMAVPVGMGPMAKFGGQQQGQMVVMPIMMAPGPGQYQPQGFVPPQVQGQQGPPGPPGPPGQQADQQGQMNSQPMYGHRPSGAG